MQPIVIKPFRKNTNFTEEQLKETLMLRESKTNIEIELFRGI